MKEKKGFTLIELLAVIVILAVIALIAVPIVLNIIENARKGSAQSSANGVRKAAQLYYSSSLIEDVNASDTTFTCDGNNCTNNHGKVLSIDGTIPTSGSIEIKADGKLIFSNIIINGYNCIIPENGNSTCTKKGKNEDENIVIGEITVTTNSIIIPFKLKNDDLAINDEPNYFTTNKLLLDINQSNLSGVTCEYGVTDKYGENGLIKDGFCFITGLNSNQVYYYKLTVTDELGKKHVKLGQINTKSFVPGEIIYYDPINGEPCYNYKLVNSKLEYYGNKELDTQNSCLKWHIVSSTDSNLDVILDHNLDQGVTWIEATNDSYFSTLENLWEGVSNIRHISADEIAAITNANSESTLKWHSSKNFIRQEENGAEVNADLDTESSWFYLDGQGSNYYVNGQGWHVATAKSIGASKYAWLYDNTANCISSGCNYEDNSNSKNIAYWTSTRINTTINEWAWVVARNGYLGNSTITNSNYMGVRPVVTIEKSSLLKKGNSYDIDFEATKPIIETKDVLYKDNSVVIPFNLKSNIGIEDVKCEYGTDVNYGSTGVVSSEKVGLIVMGNCDITNIQSHKVYYYRITVSDLFGNETVAEGQVIKNNITGEQVTLGGYKWHVLGDDGMYTKLIMDSGQLEKMSHCNIENDGTSNCEMSDFGEPIYDWSTSAIREYLNDVLYPELSQKIDYMVPSQVCVSTISGSNNAYMMDESSFLSNMSCASTVDDNIRLMSELEFESVSPALGQSAIIPGITKLAGDWQSTYGSNWFIAYNEKLLLLNNIEATKAENASVTRTQGNVLEKYEIRPVITISNIEGNF